MADRRAAGSPLEDCCPGRCRTARSRLSELRFAEQIGLRLKPPAPAYLEGVPLPLTPNRVASMGALRTLWLGPDEWLVTAPAGSRAGSDRPLAPRGRAAARGGRGPVGEPGHHRDRRPAGADAAAERLRHRPASAGFRAGPMRPDGVREAAGHHRPAQRRAGLPAVRAPLGRALAGRMADRRGRRVPFCVSALAHAIRRCPLPDNKAGSASSGESHELCGRCRAGRALFRASRSPRRSIGRRVSGSARRWRFASARGRGGCFCAWTRRARRFDLVLPRGLPPETALKFLEAQRGWIAARLDALPIRVPFAEGAVVPVFGVPHRIRREDDPAAPPVAIVDGEIRVRGGPEPVARRVRDHLARLAAQELARRARLHAARIGKEVTRITVRDTKSRWGSCSAAGSLSFSWRLIMAPEPVLDYVVAHEVAHLIEMNHSPRFWKLVRTMVADPAAQRAWLKRHRAELLSYG